MFGRHDAFLLAARINCSTISGPQRALHFQLLLDGGERRIVKRGAGNVVEPDHGAVFRGTRFPVFVKARIAAHALRSSNVIMAVNLERCRSSSSCKFVSFSEGGISPVFAR